jgi:serpin B
MNTLFGFHSRATKTPARRDLTRRARFEQLESRLFLSADRAVQAVNSFGIDLYEQLQHEQGNLFFSPLSVSTALAMTYAATAGQTAAQFEKVLHLGSAPGIHESFAALLYSLTDQTAVADGFQLEIANAMWPGIGFPLREEFIHTIETAYGGAAQTLDYSKLEQARQTINTWVEDKTHGKIKELLKELSPDVVMVLTNSIYFKAGWTTAFDPEKTNPEGEFFRENGETVSTPLMYEEMMLPEYTYVDGFQVLEMPLEGGRTSMVIALPQDPAITPNLLTPELLVKIDDWLESPREPRVTEVTLPKFNTTVGTQLEELLAGMGMPLAGDFSNMTPVDVFISQVRHKAFVEMNEQGTEASAATVVTFDACFAAGTLVLTPDGEKPIEQIKAGDYVLSRNENEVAGKIESKRVEATINGHGELVNLHIGGQIIRATKGHPFYVQGQRWTPAGELRAGDLLATGQDSWMEVEKVVAPGGRAPTHNFVVADHHTYFVGSKAWGFAVWTHNHGCGGFHFRADHPFQFFIRDNATAALLFMGRIDDPTQTANELKPTFVPSVVPATAPALLGDYNVSGTVDAADYALWRATRGNTVTAFSGADGNGNGLIDRPDFQVWQSNFGATLPVPAPLVAVAAEPVDEPAGTQDGAATGAMALDSVPAPDTPRGAVASRSATDARFALIAREQESRDAASATSPRLAAVPTHTSGNVDLLLDLDGVFSDQDSMPLGAGALDVAFSDEVDEIDLTGPLAVALACL